MRVKKIPRVVTIQSKSWFVPAPSEWVISGCPPQCDKLQDQCKRDSSQFSLFSYQYVFCVISKLRYPIFSKFLLCLKASVYFNTLGAVSAVQIEHRKSSLQANFSFWIFSRLCKNSTVGSYHFPPIFADFPAFFRLKRTFGPLPVK